MTALAFVDVETDGLHHGRQVYEIAIIRRDITGPEVIFNTFVRVPSFRISDPYGLNVGRFYDRHPQGREMTGKDPIPGPEPITTKAAARRVHELLFDAHVVGVNPALDASTLAALLRTEGFPAEPWNHHLIDLGAMAFGWLEAHDKPVVLPWRSDQLAAACEVEPPTDAERHTALGDALWSQRWYDKLTGGPS